MAENNITTPGYEPGIADREAFVEIWNKFAEANGVTQKPVRLVPEINAFTGQAPIYLMYFAPNHDTQPFTVFVDTLYGFSVQVKNERMEQLREHQGLITHQEAIGADTVLKVHWETFLNPPAPPPPVDDEVIGAPVTQDQVTAEWNGSFAGFFSVRGHGTDLPVGTIITRGTATYTLVPAPWPGISFAGPRLFWFRR